MATSVNDGQDQSIGSLAVGFSLGFGFLTVWEAIKQTTRSKNPRRSAYIYMIWGEIAANIGILILGYLLFHDLVPASVPTLFFILFFWVFQIQLLMQIIINRIAIITDSQSTIRKLKWGTAIIISVINVAVFCIFIPAHMEPPVSSTYVLVNSYWDRTSKVLICLVDAGLNYYFLRVVKQRLVEHYGLMKYEPLVKFNARLMCVSVMLDVLLIGLMSLPNQEVFILFHPLVYISKLNIEMTMASLIVRLARSGRADAYQFHPHSQPNTNSAPHQRNSTLPEDRRHRHQDGHHAEGQYTANEREIALKTFTESRIRASFSHLPEGDPGRQDAVPEGGIQRTREFRVTVHHHSSSGSMGSDSKEGIDIEDEVRLTTHPGHPTQENFT